MLSKIFSRRAVDGAALAPEARALRRDADPVLEPVGFPTSAATLPQLVAAQGDVVGPLLYDMQQSALRAAAERLQGLQVKLADINATIAETRAAAEDILATRRLAMEHAYQDYLDASSAYEARRVAAEQDLAPLLNEAHEIIRAINTPPFQDRVRNWQPTANAPVDRNA